MTHPIRAHLLVQELYAEPVALSTSASYNAFASQGSMEALRSTFGSTVGPFEMPSQLSSTLSPNGLHLVPVPLQSLVGYGVQTETVRQLTEMKGYLWRHVRFFSIDDLCDLIVIDILVSSL
jgi:hypothetical protein